LLNVKNKVFYKYFKYLQVIMRAEKADDRAVMKIFQATARPRASKTSGSISGISK
jgi:hypothetical protein